MLGQQDAIVLGSSSPRRKELLERAGFLVSVIAADVNEAVLFGETPNGYLERVVEAKLVRVQLHTGPECIVVVADTSVLCDDVILGKPRTDADAAAMLMSLAGRRHAVATRFAVARGPDVIAETHVTMVEFRVLSAVEVERYIATGEGRDKAGSYAIQGRGAAFVRRIEGSYTNVVGLPLCEVIEAITGLRGR